MASVNAPIQDSRGNRLVYRPSPLQEPKLKAALPDKAPPPRERTMIVPLEALNVPPTQSASAAGSAPADAKAENTKASPPVSSTQTSAWFYIALALVLALAIWALLSQ